MTRTFLCVLGFCCAATFAKGADDPEIGPWIWDFSAGAVFSAPAPGLSSDSINSGFIPGDLQKGVVGGVGLSVHPEWLRLTWDVSRLQHRAKAPYDLPATTDINSGIQMRTRTKARTLAYLGGGGGMLHESAIGAFGAAAAPTWNLNIGLQSYVGATWGLRFEGRYTRTIGNIDDLYISIERQGTVRVVVSIFKQSRRQGQ